MSNHSPVLHMLHLMYDRHSDSGSWSWNRLNGALAQTLHALIRVGATFALEDFVALDTDRRLAFRYWAGTETASCSGERFYGTAVTSNNRSACLAFEHWKGRKPFILDGERLYLGAQVQWQGERVTCTSFTADGQSVVLCSYTPRTLWEPCPTCRQAIQPYEREKILHRYKLRWEDLHPTVLKNNPLPLSALLGEGHDA